MLAAGVIASYGVVEYNVILIVGAMAISPDLLPITAVGVGLVDRRLRLAGRALRRWSWAWGSQAPRQRSSAFAQDQSTGLPTGFNIDSTVLGGLTTVNDETIVVALAAGVAGMLALETRASSGVGVAVSVTTIPAAAYLGVAVGLGERGNALGALEVLGTNIAMLVVAASGDAGASAAAGPARSRRAETRNGCRRMSQPYSAGSRLAARRAAIAVLQGRQLRRPYREIRQAPTTRRWRRSRGGRARAART